MQQSLHTQLLVKLQHRPVTKGKCACPTPPTTWLLHQPGTNHCIPILLDKTAQLLLHPPPPPVPPNAEFLISSPCLFYADISILHYKS